MSWRSIRLITLTALLSIGAASDAFAQRAFLYIPGIPGESVVEGFADWIDVLSLRQNAAATAKKSLACDLAVVKGIDLAGPALWATAAGGLSVPEMLIVVLRNTVAPGSGGAVITKLYDIRLTNVRITGVQATAGATDTSETLALQPQGVTLTYHTQLPNGLPGAPVTQTFSCQ